MPEFLNHPELLIVIVSAAIVLSLWVANLRAYAYFRMDKRQSEEGGLRVPEAVLLSVARRGGWIGAKLAQRRFRHKTRKEPFRTQLNRIGQRQAALIGLAGVALLTAGPRDFMERPPEFSAMPTGEITPSPYAPARSLRPVARPLLE